MILLSGVTIDGDALARNAARSTLACSPSIIFSAMTRDELANRRMDSKRLDAMTGIPTLSSKAPLVVDNEMVVSLPITCAHTIDTASTMTGLTLPGIIDDPGWRSGMLRSPRPVCGPDRSEEHTSELQSRFDLVCRLLLDKNNYFGSELLKHKLN